MRFTLAGIFLLAITASAFGQAEGQVVTMGFSSGYYRPNCWTPLKIHLKSKVADAQTYKLTVVQEDMDHDRVIYSRLVTLSGNTAQAKGEEDVWAYFLPQPRDFTRENIKIFICDTNGKQLVQIPITATSGVLNDLDAPQPGSWGNSGRRGNKLVLIVKDPASNNPRAPYGLDTHGITEDITFGPISSADLPTEAVAYQCVDTIVLLNFNPSGMSKETLFAIEQWVKEGGRLVVCTGRNWLEIKSSEIGEMLPVVIDGVDDHERDGKSLRRLAGLPDRDEVERYFESFRKVKAASTQPFADATTRPTRTSVGDVENLRPYLWNDSPSLNQPGVFYDPWSHVNGDSTIIRATPKPGALVNEWSMSSPKSPYLARWMYGQGMVVWVAQDLGDPALIEPQSLDSKLPALPNPQKGGVDSQYWGWPQVWDAVLDLQHNVGEETVTRGMAIYDEAFNRQISFTRWFADYQKYGPAGNGVDPSRAYFQFMNAGNRPLGLLALVVLFFIGYWLVAGPGSYFFLLARKRVQHSWTVFALCALGATVLAGGIVRLVFRGPPELHHVTFVRAGQGQPAIARSHMGLLIPRDGIQHIRLPGTEKEVSASITPYPVHREHLTGTADVEAVSYLEYEVPTRLTGASSDVEVQIPYRSSQKRLEAHWVGNLPGVIEGQAEVVNAARGLPGQTLTGKLTNSTGVDLYNVYLVYHATPSLPGRGQDDWMMRIIPPQNQSVAWPKGQTIDLAFLFREGLRGMYDQLENNELTDPATKQRFPAVWAQLNFIWMKHWQKSGKSDQDRISPGDRVGFSDADRAFLILSLFDRLRPLAPDDDELKQRFEYDMGKRVEILRYAERELDASHIVSSGQLLVLARSEPENKSPLPFPLEVEGVKIEGTGPVYYQFAVPITQRPAPTTQPSEERRPEPPPPDVERSGAPPVRPNVPRRPNPPRNRNIR
jgi:hypothetical protein